MNIFQAFFSHHLMKIFGLISIQKHVGLSATIRTPLQNGYNIFNMYPVAQMRSYALFGFVNFAENFLTDKLTSVSEKLGVYERGGGDLLRRGSEDMLEDLHEIDTASIMDEPRVFNTIACKTRFGTKIDPYSAPASSAGSLLCPSSSVGSLTPRSPLTTPKNSHIDFLLTDKNNFAESEDIEQVSSFSALAIGIFQSDSIVSHYNSF